MTPDNTQRITKWYGAALGWEIQDQARTPDERTFPAIASELEKLLKPPLRELVVRPKTKNDEVEISK